MKYDVFVSYSRKDYVDDNGIVIEDSPVKAIIDFLNQNQISYWFDNDGVYSGREFIELIAEAITNSKMMLFVSSKNSNASIYTTGEIFEAIENKRLIIPIKIDDSTYNSKFRLLIRPLDYIDYSDSDAFKDLLRAIEKEKETIARKEQEEAKIRRKKELEENKKTVKKEIQEYANEVHKLMIKRQTLLDTIYNKQRSINISEKECPVCQSKNQLENDYCQTCGWYFPPLSNIENCEVAIDSSALITARTKWNSVGASYEYKTANEALKKENRELKQTIDELKTQLENSESEVPVFKNKIAELENRIDEYKTGIATLSNIIDEIERKAKDEVKEKRIHGLNYYLKKHNIVTAILGVLVIAVWGLWGIVFLLSQELSDEKFSLGLFSLLMVYCNWRFLRLDKWVWGIAPLFSYLIGCSVGGGQGLGNLLLCLINMSIIALLFLLRKDGKSSFQQIGFKDTISAFSLKITEHHVVTRYLLLGALSACLFVFVNSSYYMVDGYYLYPWIYLLSMYALYKILVFNKKGILILGVLLIFFPILDSFDIFPFINSYIKAYYNMIRNGFYVVSVLIIVSLLLPKSRGIWEKINETDLYKCISVILLGLLFFYYQDYFF